MAKIEPVMGPDGRPDVYNPQERYAKARTTRLNPHGAGPFCRLKIPGLPTASGVYAVSLDGKVAYVGCAENLSERWGPRGYGLISPRNCYVGGQPTNCKINGRILRVKLEGDRADLYFHETRAFKAVERELIDALSPPWNGQTPRF